MGYLFGYANKAEAVKSVLNGAGEKLEVLDHAVYGGELYVLYGMKEKPDYRFIGVHLLRAHKKVYGVKDMDESMGPYYFNCPERILAASTCPEGAKWREQCRAVAAKKKALKGGDVLVWRGNKITYLYPLKRNQFAALNAEGKVYRYKVADVEKA
jgi:hypothetical protein